MLSYRHHFHAGNFADVHKHVVLVAMLRALARKEKGFTYVDTHAGAGRYVLDEASAARAEWRDGVERVRRVASRPGTEVPAEVADYLGLLRPPQAPHHEAPLAEYPGSPCLARALLRAQDRAVLLELHPDEAPRLKRRFRGDAQVAVYAPRDAREGLPALLPAATPRGLVLIDPSYERIEEYEETARLVATARQRWSTAAIAVWYPLLGGSRRRRHRVLLEALDEECAAAEPLRSELHLREVARPGLCGSGMLLLRPPWPLPERLPVLTRWLTDTLADDLR